MSRVGKAPITIPAGVHSIGNFSFLNCVRLGTVTISSTVNHVGDYAFGHCAELSGIYFKGDAPGFGQAALSGSGGAAIYYLPGAAGWEQPIDGLAPLLWNPRVQPGSGFGHNEAGLFGVTVLGTNDMAVAVETCTNLADAIWSPVLTVTLTNGTADFADAVSTLHPARYYRFRMP